MVVFELLLERHVPSHVFLLQWYSVVNIYRLGEMVSFHHLFLYQVVYDSVESYPQSCLRFAFATLCGLSLGGVV